MTAQRRRLASAAVLLTYIICLLCLNVDAFLVAPSFGPRSTALFAKKKSRKGPKETKTSGFGGKATEPCPCGSGLGYMACCGALHQNEQAYADATAEQVVRARYTAYAKREIDFIIGSTHPLNKNFMSDIEHWKNTIEQNCYDNFELTSCEILDERYQGEGNDEKATVQFVANMIQVDSRERTAFMETSTFERGGEHIRGGAWLYRDGEIDLPPGREEESDSAEETTTVTSETSNSD